MSRQIDVSDPASLSDEDIQYLRDRNRLDIVAQANHAAVLDAVKVVPVANEKIFELDRRIPANRTPASVIQEIREKAEGQEAEEVPPYSEWTREELRRECTARELPTGGKHAELVTRLEDDDRQHAES